MTGSDETVSWKSFRNGIDNLLDEHRPSRSGASDHDWREPVYAWARNHMPDETHLVRTVAKHEVDAREGQATKRGNRYIRQWMHGRQPLCWSWIGAIPFKLNGERIRFDAATPEDLDDAADEEHARAKNQYDEELLLITGMRDLARTARREGKTHTGELFDMEPRQPGEPIAFRTEPPPDPPDEGEDDE